MELTLSLIVFASFILIVISAIIIFVCLFIRFLRSGSLETQKANIILKTIDLLKEGKEPGSSPQKVKPSFEIKREESSLKALLIKKFKPKVEQQLGAKIEVLDFNAKQENFLVLVKISGVKILLTLDSSGKIVDYKKVKQ